ncbi:MULTISPECIES: polyprenyl synthetase family protein [Sphingobacterium]|jgi:geranylgeranyl diphosphate synthase type II|uniref:polyprenyl synthetase family protein n=1 Tax=Sphingobacterium TaxID=28453 RepID=UPI00104CBB10|nr:MULTISPECIES: polyprenyl synthetase family protein [Sphingobacterium]MCW2262566.1 geranylgeranyl diphosphate synthase type II [Sphingobacterium kitahiroshimense]NJI74541.1 polyprenyl synthetase family protein [Sphingobacterium sp. B16(2022)]TCR12686.1 geranylgeranyl diphosphate synthase type II [Sphingobacterium sp. JUb78]
MQHLQKLISDSIQNSQFPNQPNNLYDPIRYFLSLGGKRIRPALTLVAAEMFDIKEINDALPAAKSIEYFHNFSLVHDDVMDKAPLRRGKATVHEKWDLNVAILSGDGLLVKAYDELANSNPLYIADLLKTFNRVAMQVCEGQQLDMDYEHTDKISMDQYIEMIRLKTSVLLGGALQMGAILAEANLSDQKLIYEFGEYIGIAFQLQDDVLDAYGNPETFGKQIGGDILINKKTYLLVKLMEIIKEEDLTKLQNLLNATIQDNPNKLHDMLSLYQNYNIKEYADKLKDAYTQRAFERLSAINIPNHKKETLITLSTQLLIREQ